jgi:hypothetical protein
MEWLLVVGAAWLLLSVPFALLTGGVIRLADQQAAVVLGMRRADDVVPRAQPLPPPPPIRHEDVRAADPQPAPVLREEPETIPGLPVARPQPPAAETPSRARWRRSRSA